MPGKIKYMIDSIISQKSMGNPVLASSIKVKMVMKGIFPEKYDNNSEDDPNIITRLENLANEYNIRL